MESVYDLDLVLTMEFFLCNKMTISWSPLFVGRSLKVIFGKMEIKKRFFLVSKYFNKCEYFDLTFHFFFKFLRQFCQRNEHFYYRSYYGLILDSENRFYFKFNDICCLLSKIRFILLKIVICQFWVVWHQFGQVDLLYERKESFCDSFKMQMWLVFTWLLFLMV